MCVCACACARVRVCACAPVCACMHVYIYVNCGYMVTVTQFSYMNQQLRAATETVTKPVSLVTLVTAGSGACVAGSEPYAAWSRDRGGWCVFVTQPGGLTMGYVSGPHGSEAIARFAASHAACVRGLSG